MDAQLKLAGNGTAVAAVVNASASLSPRQKLEAAAQEFEAYILKMLLGEMRKSVQSGGLFEDRSTDGFRSIAEDALARHAAEARTFGLADQLMRAFDARQDAGEAE